MILFLYDYYQKTLFSRIVNTYPWAKLTTWKLNPSLTTGNV